MTDKPKPHANQGHAGPDKDGREQYKRHIDGSITVRGEIETHVPPSAIQQHTAEREEDKRRAKKNYIVGVLTLVAVVIYAGIAAWQGWLTRKVMQIAQKTYDASERPYVGIKGVDAFYTGLTPDGKNEMVLRPTQYSTAFSYRIGIQNFGPVPGDRYIAYQRIFLGQRELAFQNLEETTTIFPTETLFEAGAIRGNDLVTLETKKELLVIHITIRYDGPSGKHYIYCEKQQYDPDVASFIDLGPQKDCR